MEWIYDENVCTHILIIDCKTMYVAHSMSSK